MYDNPGLKEVVSIANWNKFVPVVKLFITGVRLTVDKATDGEDQAATADAIVFTDPDKTMFCPTI